VLGGWAITAAVALAIVYGLQEYFPYEAAPPSHIEVILYSSLTRVVWALVIAWVIIACQYGYGGPVNSFLTWSPFGPLGRLTYCSYLLSIYVQYVFQFSRRDVGYNDHPQMVTKVKTT
jgi:peptidoglycan/LPS O-acetylase OafA/YrhL